MSEETVKRAMVVFAHPDDAEFGCGGTVASWTAEGYEMAYVVATDGSKGSADPAMEPGRLIATRQEEQRQAADVLGVQEVFFLNYPDGYLEHTLALRKDIARAIRRFRPERLITMTPYRSIACARGQRRRPMAMVCSTRSASRNLSYPNVSNLPRPLE